MAPVLRLSKVRVGGHDYYLEAARRAGGPGVEPPGRWTGAGAALLGLGGRVEAAGFEAVLGGDHPENGRPLGAARERVKVAAFDLTFCAPKSVSLLGALGDGDVGAVVETAHRRAVDAGLGYLEERAFAVRRALDGVRRPVEVQGVASASFLHHTSRALDPHLHEHVVVANIGRGPDGAWSALDGRGIYAHAGAAAALYHAQLRHELTSMLGVSWTAPDRGRAEVAGIDAVARRAFSTRARAIDEHVADRQLSSPRARVVAAHATRPEKEHVDAAELRPWWRERAAAVGLGPRRLDAVLDRVCTRDLGVSAGPGPDITGDLHQLSASRDGIARRDVVRVVAGATRLGAPRHQVDEETGRALQALGLPDDRGPVGVAERRMAPPEQLRRRDLDDLLARRGLARADPRTVGRSRGLELGWG